MTESAPGPVAQAAEYMARAREVLARERRHPTLAFFFRGADVVHSEVAGYTDSSAKATYLDQALPERVRAVDADGVIVVGEAASSQGDLLVVLAEQADGESMTLSTPYLIRRIPKRTHIGGVASARPGPIPAFGAVRRVWQERQQPS